MSKSLILYSTGTKAPDQMRVPGKLKPSFIMVRGKPVYIRAEVVEGSHLEEVLNKAKPLPGETVLNTIPF